MGLFSWLRKLLGNSNRKQKTSIEERQKTSIEERQKISLEERQKVSLSKLQQEREKVLAILKESGQDSSIIDESLFEQVKPEMWTVVEKLLDSQPPGTKLKRPRSSPSGGKIPDEPKLLPRKGEKVNDGPDFTDAEKKLLQELPCSFLKDEQGQIWAIEHGKKGNQSNDFYLGQGSFNLVKFAFRQDGHLACYRVNRERSPALSELEALFATHNQINKIIIDTKGDVSFTTPYVDIAMSMNMNTKEYPHLKSLDGQTFEKTPEGIIKKVTQTTRGETKFEPLGKTMKNTVQSKHKAKFIQPFLGVDGERYVAQNSATKSVTDYAQYFLDCAQQLSDSSGHADFKLANSLFRRDGSMLRGSVIDLDLRNDIDQHDCVASTCWGYEDHGISQIDGVIEKLKREQGSQTERGSLDYIINAVRPYIQKHDVFSLGLAMLEIMSKAMAEPQKSNICILLQDLHGGYPPWCLLSEENVLGRIQSIIEGMEGSSSEAKILGLIKEMVKMPQNRISMEEVCAKIPQVFGLTNLPNIQQESWQKLEASFSDEGEIKSLIDLIKASPKERKHYVDNLELPPVYTEQFSTLSFLLHKVEPTTLVQLLGEEGISDDVRSSVPLSVKLNHLRKILPEARVFTPLLKSNPEQRQTILSHPNVPPQYKQDFANPQYLVNVWQDLHPSKSLSDLSSIRGLSEDVKSVAQRILSERQWDANRVRIAQTLGLAGKRDKLIDQHLFSQVSPKMWSLVAKVLEKEDQEGVEMKLQRPKPGKGNFTVVKKGLSPKTINLSLSHQEQELLKQLPCSFYKDDQGQIWAVEHSKRGNKDNTLYLGKGGFNLVKFAFRQDGHLACYRVNRNANEAGIINDILKDATKYCIEYCQQNSIHSNDFEFTFTQVGKKGVVRCSIGSVTKEIRYDNVPKSLAGRTFSYSEPFLSFSEVFTTPSGEKEYRSLSTKNSLESEKKGKSIEPFLGVDGFDVMHNISHRPLSDCAQYFLDCAQQLLDSGGHADFKLENSLLRNDNNSVLRGVVIDLDLRSDIFKKTRVERSCHGYENQGMIDVDRYLKKLKKAGKTLNESINLVQPAIQKHDVFSLGIVMLLSLYSSNDTTQQQKMDILSLHHDLFDANHHVCTLQPHELEIKIKSICRGMASNSPAIKLLDLIHNMVKMPNERISMEKVHAQIPEIFALSNMANIQDECWNKLQESFPDQGKIKSLIDLIKASPKERKHYVDNLELPPVYTEQFSTLSFLLHKVESTTLVQLRNEEDIPADVKTSLDSEFQQRISVLWQQLPQDRMLSCSKQERTHILRQYDVPEAFMPVFSQLSNLLRIVNPQKLKALQPPQKIAHLQELTGNPDIMTTLLKCELDARQRILSNDHIPLQYQQDFASPQYFVSFADPATLVQLRNEEDIPADVKTSLDSEFQQRISVLWQQLPQEAMLLSSKQERTQILRQHHVPEPFDFLFDLRNWLDSVKPDILEILPLPVKLKHLQELTRQPGIMTTLLKCELDARQRILSGEDIPGQYKQDFVNLSNLLSLADPQILAQFTPSQKLKHLMEIQDGRPFVTLLTSDAASRAQFLSGISIPDQYKEDFADPYFLVSVWEEVFPSKTLSIPHLSQDVKEAAQKRLSERQQDPDRNASPVSRNVNVLGRQVQDNVGSLRHNAHPPVASRNKRSGSPPPVPSRRNKPAPSSHGSPPPPPAFRRF